MAGFFSPVKSCFITCFSQLVPRHHFRAMFGPDQTLPAFSVYCYYFLLTWMHFHNLYQGIIFRQCLTPSNFARFHRHLLEQVSDYVVQSSTAPSTYHGIYKNGFMI